MTDTLILATPMQKATEMRYKYLVMNLKHLFEFLMSKFDRKGYLIREKNRTSWNPIFNSVAHLEDDADSERVSRGTFRRGSCCFVR